MSQPTLEIFIYSYFIRSLSNTPFTKTFVAYNKDEADEQWCEFCASTPYKIEFHEHLNTLPIDMKKTNISLFK